MSDEKQPSKLDMARLVIREDQKKRVEAAKAEIEQVLTKYRCRQVLVPGEISQQPGGITVIGSPGLLIQALE